MDGQSLLKKAAEARPRAYAPYSNFKVGAAILSEEQANQQEPKIYLGCNVENSAYPQCLCAEHNAVGQMITAGDKRILAIAIVNDSNSNCMPCGGCRQLLAEFASTKTQVYTQDHSLLFTELLPHPFGMKA
jgi:cytidine deaminase